MAGRAASLTLTAADVHVDGYPTVEAVRSFPSTRILSLPYVFDSTDHRRRVLDGDVGRQILGHFESRGLVGLAL